MNIMQWLSFSTILAMILVHGIWPDAFVIDKLSMLLLMLLAIPLIAPFMKKAKWFGAEFEFKDQIEKTKKLVEKSEAHAKDQYGALLNNNPRFETFSTSSAQHLVDQDPNLALAALRIDMERVLSRAVEVLVAPAPAPARSLAISESTRLLLEHKLISKEQSDALRTITQMCNKAVHGADVTAAEATEILVLANRLNQSFPTGYSLNFFPNTGYEGQCLLCEWEHCIEEMPIAEEPTDLSCPAFGHNCPGGLEVRGKCKKTMQDIPPERFGGAS